MPSCSSQLYRLKQGDEVSLAAGEGADKNQGKLDVGEDLHVLSPGMRIVFLRTYSRVVKGTPPEARPPMMDLPGNIFPGKVGHGLSSTRKEPSRWVSKGKVDGVICLVLVVDVNGSLEL